VAIEVTMPKFGLTMHEGTVQRYFKAVGEPVAAGEPLYEVETEKVLYEVEAPASGVMALQLVGEGDTVECGVAVAIIAEAGEDLADLASRYGNGAAATKPAPAAPAIDRTGTRPPTAAAARQAPLARRPVSPVARKLAAELQIDIDAIEGTGPGGRITREDVERAAAPASAAAQPSARQPVAAISATAERIPLRGARKVIAERMHSSLRDTAQITITTEADVTAATELRAHLKQTFDVTYTDMLVHSAARALVRHPRMNSHLDGAEIVTPREVNVGIAVALDEGLIVPIIRDAARKPLSDIAIESRALGEKAHAGRLKLEDVTGGTFTVTNLGTYGIDAFTPILNHGETGILGVGRIVEKPAVYRGQIAQRAMMTLSLTFDHRVIDGAPAAEFLATVIEFFNYGER
jgi:pyruvate dehydrogenase E2 component (dihydrolipoyllysine-residue acetyltransferase)